MELNLSRTRHDEKATIGVLLLNWDYVCHTLEDPPQKIKIPGKTRIPAGVYDIIFRETTGGLTHRYQAKYPWFTFHIWLQNVPNFEYIYIHIGNFEKDTDGCILVGSPAPDGGMYVINSTTTYERIYKQVSAALNRNERVTISILDE